MALNPYDGVDSPNIIWLHGPPGVGKMAIVISFAELLSKQNRLTASFFFR
ncbi:hypothetical protein CPB84DRAFT_1685285 [Gymnopilus junonius]|uniref:Nephrocystin 3-like N-terminal domain-containing protein n=1 Tax=Gymnopilus junonius TaxID=109634 RepID=A0A9P5TJP7_GYMJU|nr:hypothetical protein CPB84DRAFT_1685285 [Gymnopilus junonius]